MDGNSGVISDFKPMFDFLWKIAKVTRRQLRRWERVHSGNAIVANISLSWSNHVTWIFPGCFTRDIRDNSTTLVQPCPRLYFYPIVLTEQEEEDEQSGGSRTISGDCVEYPVYMNTVGWTLCQPQRVWLKFCFRWFRITEFFRFSRDRTWWHICRCHLLT